MITTGLSAPTELLSSSRIHAFDARSGVSSVGPPTACIGVV